LVEIRFLRLDDDICSVLNDLARERRETVSDIANELLRKQLDLERAPEANGPEPLPDRE
jgi:predicted transcriptional regulator